MIKILFFSLSANVPTASACAALARAGGHKARAVDATLLTKADREAAHLVVTHEESADLVHAAYDDGKVIVVGSFQPGNFMPERMAQAEAWVRGEADEPPDFGQVTQVALDADGLRLDGPTVAEFVKAGYQAANYPPSGYASRSTDEEVAAAIAAQGGTGPSAAELKAALAEKGIAFKGNASKASLQALLDAALNPKD